MANDDEAALEPTPVDEAADKVSPPVPGDNPKTDTDPQDPPNADPGLGPIEGQRAEQPVAPPDLPQGGEGVSDMNGPSAVRESPWGYEDHSPGSAPEPEGSELPEVQEAVAESEKEDGQ